MKTFEELKNAWQQNQKGSPEPGAYDRLSFEAMIKSRVRKHTNSAMRYFWASFTLQIIVYALLSNVILRHFNDTVILVLGFSGVAIYIPFTIMLLRQFKRMAVTKVIGDTNVSLRGYALGQYTLLLSFYRFKKRYEYVLIPLICGVGTVLFFRIYISGSIDEHLAGFSVTFFLAVISCFLAIRSENKKSFDLPLQQLRSILDEFNGEA